MIQCPACSFAFTPRKNLRRSTPAHRRYFGMLNLAWSNWPTTYSFQPIDAEAMRTFLQMRAGWVDTIQASTGSIYMLPRSIAFDKMNQAQFNELSDRVSRIIGEIIGVTGDVLLDREGAKE